MSNIINRDYQLSLIRILNSMYNDNIRQIDSLLETLNNLNESNSQIRTLLRQILSSTQNNNVNSTNASRRNGFSNRRNNDRTRIISPYIVGSVADLITRPTAPNSENLVNDILNSFMQPVEVYPTQSQIENATRRARYCDISRPINTQCPISLDDFNDNDMVTVIRHCGHIFHTDNLMNWFRTSCRCPVCRYDIREYNSNASTEFFNRTGQTNNSNNTLQQLSRQSVDSSNNDIERSEINSTISASNLFNELLGENPSNAFALYVLNSINRPQNN